MLYYIIYICSLLSFTTSPRVAVRKKEDYILLRSASPNTSVTNKPLPISTIQPGFGTYSNGIVKESPIKAYLYNKSAENSANKLNTNVSIQFFATTTFNSLDVACPSFSNNKGSLTFILYSWAGSYDLTVKGSPIKKTDFVDYKDNEQLKLKFDEPLQDGEYLLFISTENPEKGAGIWTRQEAFEGQRIYIENQVFNVARSAHMTINYTKTPKSLWGPISTI